MDNNHLIALEKSILSTCIFEIDEIQEISKNLNYKDFYLPSHQIIYKTILNLYENDLPIDEIFIRKNISQKDISDAELISIFSVNPISNISSYIDEIKEQSNLRKLDSLIVKIRKNMISNLSFEDIVSDIEKTIESLDSNNNYRITCSKEIVDKVLENMEKVANSNMVGQITGLESLDNIVNGFEDGDLIVIAARPSMGKTSLISTLATQMLSDGNGVLIESLEMPAWKIMQRLISFRSGELLMDIKKGLVQNPDKFRESTDFFARENLVINDKTNPTLKELTTRIKFVLRKNKEIKNIFVDHTGKIALNGKTREDIEIGHITNGLKKIARDFNVRVFLLQQLNRSLESRDNKRPMLSDLKNSGNIEEDADVVLGLYRDSYYKQEFDNKTDKIENAEIIVLKNRDGKIGTAYVSFDGKCAKFQNKKEVHFEPVILNYED